MLFCHLQKSVNPNGERCLFFRFLIKNVLYSDFGYKSSFSLFFCAFNKRLKPGRLKGCGF